MRHLTRYGRAEYQEYYARGYWREETFPQALREAVREHSEKNAVVHGERRLSHAELFDQVRYLAAGLEGQGVGAEDVVSVQLPNSIELVVTFLALCELGAVYNPLNPGYRRHEVESIVSAVAPAAIVCPQEFRGFDYPHLIDQVVTDSGSDAALVVVGAVPDERWHSFDGLLTVGRARIESGWQGPAAWDADGICLLGTTSGTTGVPKLYMHPTNTQLQEARTLNRELGFSADDVFLAVAPLTHRGSLMYGLFTALAAGATLVLAEEFVPTYVLDLFEREGVTAFMAIPTMALDLLGEFEQRQRDVGHLRRAMLSGAPVTDGLIERFTRAWPHCVPVSGYGLSETGYSTYLRPGDPREKLKTSGRPAPGMEIRIRKEDGSEAGPEEVGEILIRGWMVCGGYYGNQRATMETIDADGWFATGDLGFLDAQGYMHPVGRVKHMIIRGGMNIYAEEIEFLLLQHPAIVSAVVVGIQDARLGERACACIVPRPGAALDLEEGRRFFERLGVAKYKWPEFVEVFQAFPLNPVGKLDRRGIAEAVRAKFADVVPYG
jgi:non-ribosomal peptide synthetase component E (peptide arylation enzyme)